MRRVTPEPGACTGHQGEAEGERGHRRPPPGWTLGWTPGTRACAPRATPSSLGKAFCSAAPAPWKPTIVGSPKLGRDACGGVGLRGVTRPAVAAVDPGDLHPVRVYSGTRGSRVRAVPWRKETDPRCVRVCTRGGWGLRSGDFISLFIP